MRNVRVGHFGWGNGLLRLCVCRGRCMVRIVRWFRWYGGLKATGAGYLLARSGLGRYMGVTLSSSPLCMLFPFPCCACNFLNASTNGIQFSGANGLEGAGLVGLRTVVPAGQERHVVAGVVGGVTSRVTGPYLEGRRRGSFTGRVGR